MLFKQHVLEGIAAGEINLAFRRWEEARIKPGTRLRTPAGLVDIHSVQSISEQDITDEEAVRAGFHSKEEVLQNLACYEPAALYRIELSFGGTDPREILREKDELSKQDVEEIQKRLNSFDERSRHGPWTRSLLQLLENMPGERAVILTEAMNWEDKDILKRNVRKLKELGLTVSLGTGYKLSPRGKAFLKHVK